MRLRPASAARVLAGLLTSILLPGTAPGAPCAKLDEDARTLVLALDGVPFHIVRDAQLAGAFPGWPPARPLVSTFPSMTNVGFAAIFSPLGAAPVPGYELPHYDLEGDRMVSRLRVKDGGFAWRDQLDQERDGAFARLHGFSMPRRDAVRGLAKVERRVLEDSGDDLVLYLHGTDSLHHFRGTRGSARFMDDLGPWMAALQEKHLQQKGRCLRVLMLSDHGNTSRKVRRMKGLRRHLARGGFRVVKRLRRPKDVAVPVLGIVSYGALYLAQDEARSAAEHVVDHQDVALAAFVSGEREVTILAPDAEATVEWRGEAGARRFRYSLRHGDPLELQEVLPALEQAGELDDDGYASPEAWLRHSAGSAYPNAPLRLVESLDGTYVTNAATVLFSIRPGYATGRYVAHVAAHVKAGKLEGTHGGLDSVSSLGFFLTNDPALDPGGAVSAGASLRAYARLAGRGDALAEVATE